MIPTKHTSDGVRIPRRPMSGGGAPTTLTGTVVRSVESYPIQSLRTPPPPQVVTSVDIGATTRALDVRSVSGLRCLKRVGVAAAPRPPTSTMSSRPISAVSLNGVNFHREAVHTIQNRHGRRPRSAPLKPLIVTTDEAPPEDYPPTISHRPRSSLSVPPPLPPAHQAALQALVSEMTSRFLDAVRGLYFRYRRTAEEQKWTYNELAAKHPFINANRRTSTKDISITALDAAFAPTGSIPHLPQHYEQYMLAVMRRNRSAVGGLVEALRVVDAGGKPSYGLSHHHHHHQVGGGVFASGDTTPNVDGGLGATPSSAHRTLSAAWEAGGASLPTHRGAPGFRRSTIGPPNRRASSVNSARSTHTDGGASAKDTLTQPTPAPDRFPQDGDVLGLSDTSTMMDRLEALLPFYQGRHAWRRERTSYLSRCLKPLTEAPQQHPATPTTIAQDALSSSRRKGAVSVQTHTTSTQPTTPPDVSVGGISIFSAVHDSYLPPARTDTSEVPPSPTRFSLVRDVQRSIEVVRDRQAFRGQHPIPLILRHSKVLEYGTRRQKALLLQGLKGVAAPASPSALLAGAKTAVRALVVEFEEGIGSREWKGYGYEATEEDLEEIQRSRSQASSEFSNASSGGGLGLGLTLPYPELAPQIHSTRAVMCGAGTQTYLDDELMLYKQVRVGAMIQREKKVLDILGTLEAAISNLVALWGEEGLGVDVSCPRCLGIGGMDDGGGGWSKRGMCLVAPCGTSVCRRCLVAGRDDGTVLSKIPTKGVDAPSIHSGCTCTQHDGSAPAMKSTALAQLYARSFNDETPLVRNTTNTTEGRVSDKGAFDAVRSLVMGGPAVAAAAAGEVGGPQVLATGSGDLRPFGTLFPTYSRPASRSSLLREMVKGAEAKERAPAEEALAAAVPPSTTQLLDLRYSLRSIQSVLGVEELMDGNNQDDDDSPPSPVQPPKRIKAHTSRRDRVQPPEEGTKKGRRHVRHRSLRTNDVHPTATVPNPHMSSNLLPEAVVRQGADGSALRLDNPLSITRALLSDPILRNVARSTLQSLLRVSSAVEAGSQDADPVARARMVERLARVVIHSEADITAALRRLRRV